MKVYVGQSRGKGMNAILDAEGFGEMTVRREYPPRRKPWAFDNGAFGDYTRGRPFRVAEYELAIERLAADAARPDFLVVPDVVAGGRESLDFSLRWVECLRPLAPLALAVQDGMSIEDVAPIIEPFAVVFVGGSVPWKLQTGAEWVRFAHDRDRLCHIGRVGTPRRVRWAIRIGADSIDSTQPLWSYGHMKRFIAALRGDQGELFA